MVSVYLYHRQEEADNSAASSISCGRPSSQCKCIAQNNVSVSVSSIARRSSISVCARFRGQPGPHHVSVCLLASGHQDSCKATQEEKTFVGAHLHRSTWVGMGWDTHSVDWCRFSNIQANSNLAFLLERLLPSCLEEVSDYHRHHHHHCPD